jgi:DNA-binding Xre family transcriptional regulator
LNLAKRGENMSDKKMATLRVKELATNRGITTAYQLQQALKCSPSKAARLWKGDPDKIGMDTIEELCALLKVKPGRLIKLDTDAE